MEGEPVYAEVKITDPDVCQVAGISEPDTSITRVSETRIPNDEEQVTVELSVDDDPSNTDTVPTPVDEPNGVFRIQRPVRQGCACEVVEQHGCPVRNVHADGGELFLAFYAERLSTIRQIISELRDVSSGVHLQRLDQTGDDSSQDLVSINRGLFTDRQFEILQTAYEMGYFNHPKEANAGEVAATLNISTTTLSEHLMAAQTKLLDELLRE